MGRSTTTTSARAASTSSTLANCAHTHSGSSNAATLTAPSTGPGA
ncbi:Uncharacterised protein [Mycobacteroides abscessus]|nr:Uncharacterised protein [Mycobacteroides abscessus]